MTDQQMTGFNSRIKRITDPRNTFYVDGETGAFVPKRISKKQIRQVARQRDTRPTFGGLVFGLLLGALALMGARFVRWHYLSIDEQGTAADTLMMMDFGLAAVAVFIVGGLLGQKSLRHMFAQCVGIAAMLVAMHNLIWLLPEEFAMVYGQDYVNQVQDLTAPQSIYLRGEVIPIPLA